VKTDPPKIEAGRIELRQAVPHGIVHITHIGKSGARVTIALDARLLEAWAIRQMKSEVFAQ
jgi:sensor domain CHASE-containing protein